MPNSINRPLFEEPSVDCEREDPWSGPKGFMFGGWSLPSGTTWEMAQQYFDAANLLIENIERDRIEDYKLGIPVLYLYRHWLELAVKSIIGPVHGHDLEKLCGRLTTHLGQQGIKVPKWVTARLLEMAKVDRSSTPFRYAGGSIDGEIYVSLPHLRNAMRTLNVALASMALKGVFPPESLLNLIADDISSDWDYFKALDWIT